MFVHVDLDQVLMLYPLLLCIGMVPVTIDDAGMPYAQDSDGWIEVLTSEDNTQLTVWFTFRDQSFLKQLHFEGTSYRVIIFCMGRSKGSAVLRIYAIKCWEVVIELWWVVIER